MEAGLKQRWVEALQGGRYPKGRGRLRCATGTYCCLGVLADLLHPDEWESCDEGRLYQMRGRPFGLGEELLKEAGLTEDQQDDLIRINDNSDTFQRVIKLIEEEL